MSSWFEHLRQGLARALPQDRIAGRTSYADTRTNLRNLRPFVDRHWRKGALGIVAVLITSLLALPQPLVTRYLLDKVILGRQIHLLAGAVVLLGGLIGLSRLAGLAVDFYFTRMEQEILVDIQHDLLDRAMRFPKSFFDDKQTGYLMARLSTDVEGLRWFFSSTLRHLAAEAARFVGGTALLFYLEWRLALATLVAVPLLALIVNAFSRRLRILSHQRMERQANVTRHLQESLSATSLIKALRTEERAVGRVMAEVGAARTAMLEQAAVSGIANFAISLVPDLARALAVIIGAIWVVRDQWTLGSLLAFQSYLGYVYGPARLLATANLQLQEPLAALERISALYEIVPEERAGTGHKVERLLGEIEFRDVSFSYDGEETVLEHVSCKIAPGEHVAIVGPSGVGKTTLLTLILRFYNPSQGEIRFDGRPAAEYELGSLRARIGYVSQSTLLLTGTIAENLRYGNPGASEQQVVRAAQVAGIHDFIAGLPAGYGSPVGERGVNLSEGQKQRLAIARALITDPDVLVLDEPTSALDSHTEQSIFDALPAVVRGKTLFIVAHRLSTVQNADRILLLNERQLVAVGTHQELLESSDYYRSLVASQQIIGAL